MPKTRMARKLRSKGKDQGFTPERKAIVEAGERPDQGMPESATLSPQGTGRSERRVHLIAPRTTCSSCSGFRRSNNNRALAAASG